MSWRTHTQEFGPHALTQEWLAEPGAHPSHSLSTSYTKPVGTQEAMSVSLQHRDNERRYPVQHRLTKAGDGKWYLGGPSPQYSIETHPPSEALQAMIRHYHKQDAGSAAWMPLLDELATQYPDHFADHVAEHTRARMS